MTTIEAVDPPVLAERLTRTEVDDAVRRRIDRWIVAGEVG